MDAKTHAINWCARFGAVWLFYFIFIVGKIFGWVTDIVIFSQGFLVEFFIIMMLYYLTRIRVRRYILFSILKAALLFILVDAAGIGSFIVVQFIAIMLFLASYLITPRLFFTIYGIALLVLELLHGYGVIDVGFHIFIICYFYYTQAEMVRNIDYD